MFYQHLLHLQFKHLLDLYNHSWKQIKNIVSGETYNDEQIKSAMRNCYKANNYVLDPHGACGYQALKDALKPDEIGVFLETAHPAKFKEKVDDILSINLAIPERLKAFMKNERQVIDLPNDFSVFKNFLLQQ